jgi:shikimate dehydrogenase
VGAPVYSLGLIGYPLGHSLSPRLHIAGLQSCGLKGEYRLYPVDALEAERGGLQRLLGRVRQGDLHGLNVTIPYKQTIIQFMDRLTPAARAIGAVNTIYLRGSDLIGDNTDAPGFWADLKQQARGQILNAETAGEALALGAGGSARAVIYALAQAGWRIDIAARRIEQAQALADAILTVIPSAQITPCLLDESLMQLQPPGWRLLVNATPLGMTPNIDQTPWPKGLPFPNGVFVYDLIYNPAETRLVREASQAGLKAVTGLGMLVEQAALAFCLWTGCAPDREAMRRAVD